MVARDVPDQDLGGDGAGDAVARVPGVVAAAAVFGLDKKLLGRTSSGSTAALILWDYAGVTILRTR
jgi:hypothetical protein